MTVELVAIASAVLVSAALLLRLWAFAGRLRAGTWRGRVLYSDTGAAAGPARTFVSERYGLKGKPDYVLEVGRGAVAPVEVKSGRRPRGGRAHRGHVMQLAVYCLLCEEAYGAKVPYGVVRYADGEVKVAFTSALRRELLGLIDEIRRARWAGATRTHSDARRCAGCSFAGVCEQSLA